jgi:translation initiation factor IF-2
MRPEKKEKSQRASTASSATAPGPGPVPAPEAADAPPASAGGSAGGAAGDEAGSVVAAPIGAPPELARAEYPPPRTPAGRPPSAVGGARLTPAAIAWIDASVAAVGVRPTEAVGPVSRRLGLAEGQGKPRPETIGNADGSVMPDSRREATIEGIWGSDPATTPPRNVPNTPVGAGGSWPPPLNREGSSGTERPGGPGPEPLGGAGTGSEPPGGPARIDCSSEPSVAEPIGRSASPTVSIVFEAI